ncbi:MAG: hypothetical protein KGR26_09255, partial [Cyanobacteria bacterium REEB65]|nr:hypothetical protein [Cyanobacteria bacterium REEB65]
MQAVQYRLSLARPNTHRAHIEMRIPPTHGPVDLGIPAWMPGAYKMVDHARNIRKVAARSSVSSQEGLGCESSRPSPNRPRTMGAEPGALVVERLDLHTWRIHGAENGAVVTYEVFADKLMIHEGQINADHAFLNGSVVWLAVLHALQLPCRVTVDVPEGWTLLTALTPAGADSYGAPDYDALADAPLEAGEFGHGSVVAEGVTWEIAWDGSDPEQAVKRVCSVLPVLAREAVAIFGPAPFDRYVCFLHDCDEPGYLNGLEHRTSMAIQGPLDVLTRPTPFFVMMAHEILHAWNGQRLAPTGLYRPGCDYFRPAHTTALWVVEGWTEYFASLLCLRAGLLDPPAYLANLADFFDSYFRTPGRRCTTLEEASFITWNFGDDRWNGAINYYLKGLLAAFALDIEIRVRTGGRRALDDVLRALWEQYGDRLPYEPADVERLAAEIAGQDLGDFF